MTYELTETSSLLKTFILLFLFFLITGIVFQMDLPNVQDISNYFHNKMVERQFQLNGNGENLLKQGWTYYSLGQFNRAEQIMKKVLEKGYNTSADYCLGLIAMKYGHYAKAAERFQRVSDRSPNHIFTRLYLGEAYYELRYYGKACRVLEETLRIEPANEEVRLLLAKSYLKQGKLEPALENLKTVTHGSEALEAAALMKKLR